MKSKSRSERQRKKKTNFELSKQIRAQKSVIHKYTTFKILQNIEFTFPSSANPFALTFLTTIIHPIIILRLVKTA